jgi:hypothetical protein
LNQLNIGTGSEVEEDQTNEQAPPLPPPNSPSDDVNSAESSDSEYSYSYEGDTDDNTSDTDSMPPLEEIIPMTENGARSYDTCHDGRVELFFKMCEASWNEDPLDTIKMIFQTRDCRGGKGERQLFMEMMAWLTTKNCASVLVNLDLVPEYGRWLDLVELSENSQLNTVITMMLAKKLKEDHALMMLGKPVSLCAKWIPSEGSKWDRKLHTCTNIAKALQTDLKGLRKQYLSPLRAYLKIVERYMCDKKWPEIDYSKVPSVAMHRLKKAFARNDPVRFAEWKAALSAGRPDVKVNAKVLFPHDLVTQYLEKRAPFDQVIESQWKVLVEETKKLGKFGRSLAICDVSGSMNGVPLNVCVALGIMISGCLEEPFRNKVITFSANPQFHDITGNTLHEQVNSLNKADWGMNTDFIAVFRLLLDKARQHNLTPEQMPNRLYVFSDMQFDQAVSKNYDTNYEAIQKMYTDAGYTIPEIVFWNLRGDTLDFPVGDSKKRGVAMVSGFTTSILKALLNGRQLSPITVLWDTLDSPRYSAIKYMP